MYRIDCKFKQNHFKLHLVNCVALSGCSTGGDRVPMFALLSFRNTYSPRYTHLLRNETGSPCHIPCTEIVPSEWFNVNCTDEWKRF